MKKSKLEKLELSVEKLEERIAPRFGFFGGAGEGEGEGEGRGEGEGHDEGRGH